MNKSLSALAFASIAVLAASAAHAQAQAPAANAAVRTERNMSLDLANRIATAAVAACSEKGYAVTPPWWTARAPSVPFSVLTMPAPTPGS